MPMATSYYYSKLLAIKRYNHPACVVNDSSYFTISSTCPKRTNSPRKKTNMGWWRITEAVGDKAFPTTSGRHYESILSVILSDDQTLQYLTEGLHTCQQQLSTVHIHKTWNRRENLNVIFVWYYGITTGALIFLFLLIDYFNNYRNAREIKIRSPRAK